MTAIVMKPVISIIIVNYRSAHFLANCLASIAKQPFTMAFEVLVIDNSPGQDEAASVVAGFPWATYVANTANDGFARANNIGISKAAGELLLLLNADTIIENNAIDACAALLQKDAQAVAAGIQLQYADGSPQISGSHNLPGALNFLMTIPYVGRVLRALALAIAVKKPSIESAVSTEEVDWINGAYLMARKSAVERAGPLDSDFFLYHEESEWCGRLQRFGKLYLYGHLTSIHLEGGSSSQAYQSATKAYTQLSDRKGRQLLLSMWLRIGKQFGRGWLLLHVAAHLFSLPVVLLCALLQLSVGQRSSWRQASGYVGNVFHCLAWVPAMLARRHQLYKI